MPKAVNYDVKRIYIIYCIRCREEVSPSPLAREPETRLEVDAMIDDHEKTVHGNTEET